MKQENINKLSYDYLEGLFNKKGYGYNNILNKKLYEISIIGIRSETPVINSFDDLIVVLWKEENAGQITKNIFTSNATTIPGLWGLSKQEAINNKVADELNPEGTAIVAEGIYTDLWKIGMHKGKESLVQDGPINIYRQTLLDGNIHVEDKTTKLILNIKDIGIDGHNCREDKICLLVNNWSLGCIVQNDPKKFKEFMRLCHQQVTKTQNTKFDYGLINEKDLI